MSFSLKGGGFLPMMITLSSSMIGVGFLTLPQIGKHNGMISMVLLVLVAFGMCLIANFQISRAFYHSKKKTYAELVEALEGPVVGKIAGVLVSTFVYLASTMFYSFIPQIILSFLNNTRAKPSWLTDEQTFSTYLILALLPITLICSLSPKISSLRYFAFLTSFIGVLITLIIVMSRNAYGKVYEQSRARAVAFSFNMRLFGSYYLSLLATMNQFAVANILGELNRPTEKRIYKLIAASKVIPLVSCLGVAVAGYSICGDQCPDLIINMKPPVDGSNPIIDYCKLLLVICLVVSIILRTQISHTSLIKAIQYICRDMDSSIGMETASLLVLDPNAEVHHQADARLGRITQEPSAILYYTSAMGNACIPVFFALLIHKDFLKHLQASFGLISPILMIVFPCRMTLRLHEARLIEASVVHIRAVKSFMAVLTVLSYVCLAVYLLDIYF